MMNRKGYGRNQAWFNLRFYPSICLEALRKTTKTSVWIAGLWVRFEQGPPKYKAGVSTI
jgi:hypothetical protein